MGRWFTMSYSLSTFSASTAASPLTISAGASDDLLLLDASSEANRFAVQHISVYASGFAPTDAGALVRIQRFNNNGGTDLITKAAWSSPTYFGSLDAIYSRDGSASTQSQVVTFGSLNYYEPSFRIDFALGQELEMRSTYPYELSIAVFSYTDDIDFIANVVWGPYG